MPASPVVTEGEGDGDWGGLLVGPALVDGAVGAEVGGLTESPPNGQQALVVSTTKAASALIVRTRKGWNLIATPKVGSVETGATLETAGPGGHR